MVDYQIRSIWRLTNKSEETKNPQEQREQQRVETGWVDLSATQQASEDNVNDFQG